MELSRRDALAALSSAGIVAGGGAAVFSREYEPAGDDPGEAVLATLSAVADVVYPSEVENVGEFVETYATERLRGRPDYREGLERTVSDLDDYAVVHADAESFADLDPDRREAVLLWIGADTADPDPGGIVSERVRYYLVNDLLFALYASPTGGELVGIENPQGHPGGRTHGRRPR